MLFAVALLAGLAVLQVGAPPTPISGRPPEDIVCDQDSIYGYVDTDASVGPQSESWFQLDVASSDLHECIRRCYGYRFCYSVTFDHNRVKPCVFYLHASEKCSGRDLVNINTLEYHQQPVTVACLKCGEALKTASKPADKNTPELSFSHDESPATTEQKPVISESKDDNIQKLTADSKPTTPSPHFRQSCVVTFQVFKSENVETYSTTKVATVGSITECAYICYQNSCSGAIFVPPTAEGKKGRCKVQMKGSEMCSGRLQRHYGFKTESAIVLSCFRCEPDHPVTLSSDAEIPRATTTPQPHLVEHLLTDATTHAPEAATTAKPAEATTAKSSEAPAATTEASKATEAATEAPKAAEPTTEAPKAAESSPEAPKPTEAPKPVDNKVEEKPANVPAATGSPMVDLGTVTTGPVVFGGGCLITFQADYLAARPAEFKSEFELNLLTETAEICATRCFQDGCTGALFFPNNGTCVLGYGDKYHCNKRPMVNFLKLEASDKDETLWIHCAGCRSSKHGSTGPITGNMKDNKVVGSGITEKPSTVAVTAVPPTTTTTAATTTEAPKSEQTTKAAEPTKPAPQDDVTATKGSAHPPGMTPAMTTEASTTTTAPPAPAAAASSAEEEAGQGCLITFQAGDLADRPKEFTSEFELNLLTETPEICATRCYQDGCTGAMFFPKNGTCVLGYGDKHYCDKKPILRFYRPNETEKKKESLWIHCTFCRAAKHGETFTAEATEKPQSMS